MHVVYDGSGPKTFQGSLDVLCRTGTFRRYVPVLGGPGPIDLMGLSRRTRMPTWQAARASGKLLLKP